MKKTIVVFLLFISISSFPQKKKERGRDIVDFELKHDSKVALELEDEFALELTSALRKGKKKRTFGSKLISFHWHRFNIDVENGKFRNGTIYFNRENVLKNGNAIKVELSPKRFPEKKKQYLIKIPYLEKIKLGYSETTSVLAQGYNIPIRITAMFSNGKQFSVKGNEYGESMKWSDFEVFANGDTLKKGNIHVQKTIDNIEETIDIECSYKLNPEIIGTLQIPLDYKADYFYDFSGKDGVDGVNGEDAEEANGNDGKYGWSGTGGANGSDISMFVESVCQSKDTLLKVSIYTIKSKEYITINSSGAGIYLISNGGNGGSGGNGGYGGNGIDETENQEAGNGGNGGSGGDGGCGGNIYIFSDHIAGFFLNRINIENIGGRGGTGGYGGEKGMAGQTTESKMAVQILDAMLGLRNGKDGKDGANGINGPDGLVKCEYINIEELQKRKREYEINSY